MKNTSHSLRKLGGLLLLATLLSSAQVHASEMKNVMKDMKAAMRGAMNSTSIAEFTQYSTRLQNDAITADKLQYRRNPAVYHKGLQQMQTEMDAVNQAVRANDLNAAKNALQKINSTKKQYHHLLS
ncbi:MAG: cytochrome b562 [Betaproteobacteria bacterium]|nr:cytochrome b562 [Betaproteobacteria bacterium]